MSLRSEMNNSRDVIQNLVQSIQVMSPISQTMKVHSKYELCCQLSGRQASNDAYHKKVVSLIFRHHPFIPVFIKTFILLRCCRLYHSQPPSPRCFQSGRSPAAGSLPIRTTSCACGDSHPVGQNHQLIAHQLWMFTSVFTFYYVKHEKEMEPTIGGTFGRSPILGFFCPSSSASSPSISLLVAKGMERWHLQGLVDKGA